MVQGKDYKLLIVHKKLLPHEIAMENSLCHFIIYLLCMFRAHSDQRPHRKIHISPKETHINF